VLIEIDASLWDRRSWDLALKSDNPVENYEEARKRRKELEQTPTVDELPQERRDWLRAT
jgi:hypothetical protein